MRLFALIALTLAAPAFASPPATVAVAFDRQSIRPVLAEGEADRATGRPVSADDPVRIASISKLVTALGVMRLVDRGQLDLDRDVSDYLGWRLRNPAFPKRVITLNMLLSHRSSLLDGDDLYIIPLGTTLRERLADPRVWDAQHPPGSDWFRYTNLNFPVIASAMERAGGERFDRLMARLVFRPLRIDACFNWGEGCSDEKVRKAVVLYRADGSVARDDLGGKRPHCLVVSGTGGACDLGSYVLGHNGALFSPQGGLRISTRDLARIGQVLGRGGKGFLSAKAMARLEQPLWTLDGANGLDEDGQAGGFFCSYALALHRIGNDGRGCRDNLFGPHQVRIGHAGDAYGLKSGLWWDPVSGKGLAFFTAAVPEKDPGLRSTFTAAEERVVDRMRDAAFP
ncbi:CubicO group peptidase (beta-lactamase class C family) [Novosphingobium kunmingense]|uniref:CubicO group peptidase (Beta-lactamase class C family) n=1 Tax=Novosphingobium kunmingense TaxID=1211806 RepID=A0A2N0H7F1_9SPHN|nr:serine hydrolase domain-containing protein [Novosphingobium kunmingense]PKB14873.1 CubicO group peptidase (beta-lactamase class C family) [Novosphingobium kunmingense]